MADKGNLGEVKLRNVRLSFASLFEVNVQRGDDDSERRTYKSNFLIPKDKDDEDAQANLKKIQKAAAEVQAKKFGEDKKKWPKIRPDKKCLRDGDEENWDGYEGNWYLSANSPESRPPRIITNRKDAENRWIPAQPGEKAAPYSGCYVNAIVRIWFQDNEHGKRINASLEAVQFLRDGEPFGPAPINVDAAFDDDDVGEYGEIADGDEDDDDDDDDGSVI